MVKGEGGGDPGYVVRAVLAGAVASRRVASIVMTLGNCLPLVGLVDDEVQGEPVQQPAAIVGDACARRAAVVGLQHLSTAQG